MDTTDALATTQIRYSTIHASTRLLLKDVAPARFLVRPPTPQIQSFTSPDNFCYIFLAVYRSCSLLGNDEQHGTQRQAGALNNAACDESCARGLRLASHEIDVPRCFMRSERMFARAGDLVQQYRLQ
jgi:hypothetical protein